MKLTDNKELTENKLILLYIVDRLNEPVSNLKIMKIILEHKLMNYFIFQQFLKELTDGNLLKIDVLNTKSFYKITNQGKQALGYFIDRIPKGIRCRIDGSIPQILDSIKNESRIIAEFIPGNNEYTVSCQVYERDFTLIDLKVCVGGKNDARTVCKNWKKNAHLIYPEIIEILLKKRD